MSYLIVGERRSPKAIRLGLTWESGGLAAKPLFEALRTAGVDPAICQFVNWFEGGEAIVRKHRGRIIGLGQKVQKALTGAGISHIPVVHPAARGKIRLRTNYVAHVVTQLRRTDEAHSMAPR